MSVYILYTILVLFCPSYFCSRRISLLICSRLCLLCILTVENFRKRKSRLVQMYHPLRISFYRQVARLVDKWMSLHDLTVHVSNRDIMMYLPGSLFHIKTKFNSIYISQS